MKRTCLLLCGLLILALCGAARAGEESPAEKNAREWFLAVLKGDTAKVARLTRVPFAAGDKPVHTVQLMEEYLFPYIADNKRKFAQMDLPPDAIKVRKLDKAQERLHRRPQLHEYVAASQFIEITIGKDSCVLMLTRGNNPKVVGFSK
ncbi:MAG: hypothetical protein N2689_09715 [Verrucomicrobiae bacterium]|nr:hypothetical protein [Verrucomicrobiae bacterium]